MSNYKIMGKIGIEIRYHEDSDVITYEVYLKGGDPLNRPKGEGYTIEAAVEDMVSRIRDVRKNVIEQ